MSASRQANLFFQSVFYHLSLGIARVDCDGRVQQVNPACSDLFGVPCAEFEGKSWSDFIHLNDLAIFDKLCTTIISGERSEFENEFRYLCASDEPFHAWTKVTRLDDELQHTPNLLIQIGEVTRQNMSEQSEEALQQLATIVASSDDAIISKSTEGIITSWNKAAEKIFGYSAEEAINQSIEIILPENYLQEEADIQARLRNHEIIKNLETVRRRKDGRLIDVSVTISAIKDQSGRITGISKIARYISEQKAIENALRKSQNKMAEVQRLSKTGGWELDLINNKLTWSDEIYSIFEVYPDKFKASYEDFIELVHIDDRDSVNQAYARSLKSRTPYVIEHRVQLPDGRIKWVLERGETVYDEGGVPLRSLGTVQDITERIQLKEELRYREKQFRSLAENSPHIIMRFDKHCNRIYVNPAFARETGVSDEKALQAPIGQWGAGASLSRLEFKNKLKQVMQTGVPAELCIDWYRLDTGEPSSHIFNIVAEYSTNGDLLGVLVIGNNVTSLKQIERRLKNSQTQLRGLAEAMENIREDERKRIAQDMHDELGQYLTGLRMEVSVLRMSLGDSQTKLLSQVEEIKNLVDKTISVVREIATSLRPASLDMGLTSALEWLVEEFSRRSGISCYFETDEDEIKLSDRSATAVFRMVQESLTNVARHANAGQVDIHFHRKQNALRIEIRDNGQGFDVTAIPTNSFGLVGLRERALMVGANVKVDSEPGQGTSVIILIPLTEVNLQHD